MGPLLNTKTVNDLKIQAAPKNAENETDPSKSPSTSDNLFIAPSFLNHSCQPNAHRSFFRDDSSVIFIKAIKDITEFEEVTISYIDLLGSVAERESET